MFFFFLRSNKNGHKISIVGDKSVLTIEMSAVSEPSTYQCFGRNEYGSHQADVFVNPFASSQNKPTFDSSSSSGSSKHPQIIFGPQNTTIYEGQTVVLLCVTNSDQSAASAGSPSPAASSSGIGNGNGNTLINWLQNGLIIEPTLMRRFEINQLLGNLRIVSVQKSDAGLYKCIASNEYGMSTAEAYVTVKSAGSSSGAAASNNNNRVPNGN